MCSGKGKNKCLCKCGNDCIGIGYVVVCDGRGGWMLCVGMVLF